MTEKTKTVYILLYSGRSVISWAIRWQTRSKFSHAAFQFGDSIIESVEGIGVRQRFFESSDANAKRLAVELTEKQYYNLLTWAQSHIGEKYDWIAILRFLSRRSWYRDDTWFCSEFVFAGLESVGKLLFKNTEPWEVSPGLIDRSPILIEVTAGT